MSSTPYPNTRAGRIAKLQAQIAHLEDMIATGVVSSSIDGLTVTYRNREAIEATITKLKLERNKLATNSTGPFGQSYPV